MPIIDFKPPRTGRTPRLSDEELEHLAQKVRAGGWASDGVAVEAKSCAYQRAQTAVKLLGQRFGLEHLKTHASPVDPNITPLDTKREKLLKQIKKTNAETEIQALQEETETLRQQIADMGGYHWAVGPSSAAA